MRKCLAKRQPKARSGAYLWRKAALLVTLLIVLGAVFSGTMLRRPSTAVEDSTWQADVPDLHDTDRVAAIDVDAVIQVTPEYAVMSRFPADSPEHRILHRKARLRVAAAAQYVARKQRYSAVLCSPSSSLPDITDCVMSRIVSPSLDFFPVAQLSDRPFTGGVILAGV